MHYNCSTNLVQQTTDLECYHLSFGNSTNKETISTTSSNWVLLGEATQHQYSVKLQTNVIT